MDFYSYCQNNPIPKWPYPVEYGQETRDSADVLVIGGGMAGCFAAIHAARLGKSVIVVEKGATVRSGAAGAGIDHWMFTATCPAAKLGPDEMFKIFDNRDPFESKHLLYITLNEAYEALLDLEGMGVKIRDTDDDFAGAPFRDEETKHLFAYDYDGRYCIRMFGGKLKIALHKEMKRLGIKIYDRVMATALLNEDGKPGSRVVGAAGVGTRTGRFYVFNAKATVLATAKPLRLWEFGTENVGSYSAHDDPNCAGDGDVMALRAGAQLVTMERTGSCVGKYRYPAYGGGNASNTWYPANMVDGENRSVQWVNRDGEPVPDPDDRCRCAEGQDAFMPMGAAPYEIRGFSFAPDTAQRIKNGDLKYPFFADLTTMPEYERRAIFGLMVGNEGKSRVPVYRYLTQAGFDPEKDMLQANIVPPDAAGLNMNYWSASYPGCNNINVREVAFFNYGGIKVDWEMKSTLPGLFAAGNQAAGVEGASTAAATGRYCGRQTAAFCDENELLPTVETQISAEKERIYSFISEDGRFGWKEVQIGLCRMMQDYVGATKSRETLEMGRWWLDSIRENELRHITVRNPHDLVRALECDVRLEAGKIIIESSLARETNSRALDFHRIDNDTYLPPEEDHYVGITLRDGKVVSENISMHWWLGGVYCGSYKENYEKYSKGGAVK